MPRLLNIFAGCLAAYSYLVMPQLARADDMPVTTISSVPRAEPDPPLRYSLVPDYMDLVPANAAICYYRAILSMPREQEKRFGSLQSDWLDAPLDRFPQDLTRDWLVPYSDALAEVKTAAYRHRCEWDVQVRELTGMEVIGFRLPEIQELRELARVLRLKSRLEIAAGDYDGARQTLILGYRLATHTAESPLLLNQLVSVAIASLMNGSIVDWMNSGGPNLYWGLASLPSPLVDIRTAVELESTTALRMFPFLRNPEDLQYTPQQWQAELAKSLELMGMIGEHSAAANALAQTAASVMLLAAYPDAKAALIDSGMDPQRVEAMPVGQVVAIQTSRRIRKAIDETTKWTYLPYWQAYRQMNKSLRQLHETGYIGANGKLPGVLAIASTLPATEPVFLSPVRLQRELAALQTIEALRMSAAEHKGQLPQSLTELENCPAPIDPITGAPFIYRIEGGQAVLELPPPEQRDPAKLGGYYRIDLRAESAAQ